MTPLDVLSLADAKSFLKVDFSDDDQLITGLISSAIAVVERKTNYRLYNRQEIDHSDGTYNVDLLQFPLNTVSVQNIEGDPQPQFQVKINPIRTTIIFVKYGSGIRPFYSPDGLYNKIPDFMGASLPLYNIVCNVGYSNDPDSGYPQVADIPFPLTQAIKTLVNYMYENRDMANVDMPSNISIELESYNREPLF